jgi:hypothetical protein
MATKQNEGAGSSKVVTPEQHEAARKAAQARKRANKGGQRIQPLIGEDTRVRNLTLAEKRERAEKRHARDYEAIQEIERLLRDGKIADSRREHVTAKLQALKEKVGAARF